MTTNYCKYFLANRQFKHLFVGHCYNCNKTGFKIFDFKFNCLDKNCLVLFFLGFGAINFTWLKMLSVNKYILYVDCM